MLLDTAWNLSRDRGCRLGTSIKNKNVWNLRILEEMPWKKKEEISVCGGNVAKEYHCPPYPVWMISATCSLAHNNETLVGSPST